MNSLQKAQIEKMRAFGFGFNEISHMMDIPVSTIKSYCYSHGILDTSDQIGGVCCPQCGQPVPKMRFKPRHFCSDACRVQYWHRHPDEMKKRSSVELRCLRCGKPFYDYSHVFQL